jgi:hypothetical protein
MDIEFVRGRLNERDIKQFWVDLTLNCDRIILQALCHTISSINIIFKAINDSTDAILLSKSNI